MILSKIVSVGISQRTVEHYSSLGYTWNKLHKRQEVLIAHLPIGSRAKVEIQCDWCPKIFSRAFNKLKFKQIQICSTCVKKENAQYRIENPTEKLKEYRQKLSTRMIGSNHPNWNPNKEEFKRYSSMVHNESDRVYNKYIKEINPNNHPRTRCGIEGGYQLDHKFPVKDAFLNGWSIQKCSDKENLQMLPWLENNLKAKVSLINRNRRTI